MAESINTRHVRPARAGHCRRAAARPKADIRALIDQGPFLPEDAVRAGLIDDLAYEDQIDDKAKLGRGDVEAASSATTTTRSAWRRSA